MPANSPQGRIEEHFMKARNCLSTDFGIENQSQYKSWEGYSLICPETKNFILQGDFASSKSITCGINVKRCNNKLQKRKGRKPCYSK